MTFDWSAFSDFEDSPAERSEELMPDGRHSGVIGWARVKATNREWASHAEGNPDGLTLTVRIDCKGYKSVFHEVPLHWQGRLSQVIRACGMEVPTGQFDEQSLVGAIVDFKTLRRTSKSGNEFVTITDFLRPAGEAAEPPPLAKAVAKKSRNAVQGGDDIPF